MSGLMTWCWLRIHRLKDMAKVTRVEHSWAAQFAPDGNPVIGFDDEGEGFFWLAGQGGYGIQTSPSNAMLTADLCLGRKPQPDADYRLTVTGTLLVKGRHDTNRCDQDGIGSDCIDATLPMAKKHFAAVGLAMPRLDEINAGAGYFRETGHDIELDGEARAENADAILLGAIGLPGIRLDDGTEISPHLRLRDRLGLYAGVQTCAGIAVAKILAADEASSIDLVLIRESTEGLFYSAAVHNRSHVIDNVLVEETLRITRKTTEKLHKYVFNVAARRRADYPGRVTCVDKANVFTAMAFFRQIFDEIAAIVPDITADHAYVDAMALELVGQPWAYDVLVTENMFGDIHFLIYAPVLSAAWGLRPVVKLVMLTVFFSLHMAAHLISWGRTKPIRLPRF